MSSLRILGIDPGLRVTGFGVIEKSGSKLTYITSGCIRVPVGELVDLAEIPGRDVEVAGDVLHRIDDVLVGQIDARNAVVVDVGDLRRGIVHGVARSRRIRLTTG